MIKLLITLVCLCSVGFSYEFAPTEQKSVGKITILDVKNLDFDSLNGIDFKGVSDLAYDKEKGLFALSDFGYLYKLDLQLKNRKISHISLLNAYVLKNKKGKKLKKKKSDSEGMVFSKKGLIISFERQPKISLFDFQGQKIKNYKLAKELEDIKNYQKKNKALESLVKHPDFGLITAPEISLKGEDKNYHILYSKNRQWKFSASHKITAMELLSDDNLLVLERDFSYLKGYSITLKKVNIMDCKEICKSEILADLKSTQGWNLENFEGLTHLYDNVYLMVSDDNGSFLQKTLLVLFEINITQKSQ